MTTILGVSLGCRITGIAILKGTELLVARSITLRNKATKAHTAIMDTYIRQYRIEVIVIKVPPRTHFTERLEYLLRQCLSLFQYHGCLVDYKDAKQIKARCPELGNKKSIIQFATAAYPALTLLHQKELTNKQRYHVKMFEAVAIAHITRTGALSKPVLSDK